MATYKIDWLERGTTSTGKVKADATLIGEDGNKTTVTIWGDFLGFAELMPGGTVEGEITPSRDPKYKPSLNAPKLPRSAVTGTYRGKAIEEAQTRKAEQITRFQSDKEESIRLMSAERDAVLIVITFYKDRWSSDAVLTNELDNLIKKKVVEWRDYFLSHEFNQTLPF